MKVVRYRQAQNISVGDLVYVRVHGDIPTPTDGEGVTNTLFDTVTEVNSTDEGTTIVTWNRYFKPNTIKLVDLLDEQTVLRGENA